MTLKTAQGLLRENYRAMPLEQLQRFRVRLVDALYHADGKYGMGVGVAEGFFKILESDSASGYVPSDMWLAHNLNWTLGEVRKREAELMGISMHEFLYGKDDYENDEPDV